jgi:hypothetical protein
VVAMADEMRKITLYIEPEIYDAAAAVVDAGEKSEDPREVLKGLLEEWMEDVSEMGLVYMITEAVDFERKGRP